jgi:hypothetical protein
MRHLCFRGHLLQPLCTFICMFEACHMTLTLPAAVIVTLRCLILLQVSCALGQQALEGRRVPIMPSGKSLPR